MARKLQLLILIFLINLSLDSAYSLDWLTEVSNQFIDKETEKMGALERVLFYRENNNLKMSYNVGSEEHIETFLLSDMELDELTGFIELEIDDIKLYYIPGNEYLLIFDKEMKDSSAKIYEIYIVGMVSKFLTNRNRNNYDNALRYYAPPYLDKSSYSFNEKSITTSGYYSEVLRGHNINYDGKYIYDFIMYGDSRAFYSTCYNPIAYPWVESSEGYGEGEWIQIDTEVAKDRFYVVNGFVDPTRPQLYKMNSRVKTAKVIGTTAEGNKIEQEVHFEDFVYCKNIIFPEPVKSMRLIIQSVYPGTKWKDTAISGIMLPVDYGKN